MEALQDFKRWCNLTRNLTRNHFVVTLSSLCRHFVVTLSSLCRHFFVTFSSLSRHFLVTFSSLPHHFVVTLSSCWHHVVIMLPSCYHHVVIMTAWYVTYCTQLQAASHNVLVSGCRLRHEPEPELTPSSPSSIILGLNGSYNFYSNIQTFSFAMLSSCWGVTLLASLSCASSLYLYSL